MTDPVDPRARGRLQIGGLLPTDLRYAIERLARSAGRVARNNARAEVRKVMKRTEAFIDRMYPVIPKGKKPDKKGRLTLQTFKARMNNKGYTQVVEAGGGVVQLSWVEAKVPIRKAPDGSVWVPWWAARNFNLTVSQLRELKRSPKARAVMFTQKALGADGHK